MKQTTSKPFTSNATQGHTFTMQRSAEIVGRAFAPLPCVAATVGFSTRVAFEVTDGKKTIVKGSIPPDLAQRTTTFATRSCVTAEPSKHRV